MRVSTADWLAGGAAVLGAIVAAAGLFARGLYRDNPFWTEQTRGIDLATLFLAAPILIVSLALIARGSRVALPVELGVLLYLAYNYAIYTTSVAMNRFALIYIGVLGLSIWSAMLLVSSPSLGTASRALMGTSLGTAAAVFLLVITVMFGLLWLSQVIGATVSGHSPTDLMRTGLPANPVYALDLAVFLPLAAISAIAVLRSLSPAADFALPMLLWAFLTSAGIAAGFLVEARAGEAVPVPIAALITLLGLAALALAALTVVQAGRQAM